MSPFPADLLDLPPSCRLTFLAIRDGVERTDEMATWTGLAESSCRQAAHRLEQEGLAASTRCLDDPRRALYHLATDKTDDGQRVML